MKIIAVTGCPTGIAHTFMAKGALEEAAELLGVDIKVETHGQIGVENQISSSEIAESDAVIIAADKNVDADRFIGKPCIEVSVAKAIKDADELINKAISGNLPIKGGKKVETTSVETGKKDQGNSIGHEIYKHLMNGVSYMIPFVVGGGVLVAISLMFGIYSADPTSDQYNQFAYILNTIGGTSMGLMVPIIAAYIAESISGRSALAPGFVGGVIADASGMGFIGGILAGFIAGYLLVLFKRLLEGLPKGLSGLKAVFIFPILGVLSTGLIMTVMGSPIASFNEGLQTFIIGFNDANPIVLGLIITVANPVIMGGPFNKAAWLVGTALLAEGNYYFMAGVSAACITPPIMTGLATVIYKKYFDDEERNQGMVNFLLGATHITEGAIPFAAKNPLIVLPIIMGSSSIAAILTYLFRIQDPAPHGGFLILPLIDKPILWLIAIFTGSLIGALVFGNYRKATYNKNKSA